MKGLSELVRQRRALLQAISKCLFLLFCNEKKHLEMP